MYINVNHQSKIDYEVFVKRASKLTKAKGVFNNVEENIRDYFKPYTSEGVYLIDGSTHEENKGKIMVGLTLYNDLQSIHDDVLGFRNGTNEFFKRRERNTLSSKTILKILTHFLIK